jgi:hypothetical protein
MYAAMAAEQASRVLSIGEEEFLEKSFYLDEFHEKTLMLAIAPGAASESDVADLLATARELIRAEVRLVLAVADAEMARRLEGRFRRGRRIAPTNDRRGSDGGGARRRIADAALEPVACRADRRCVVA